MFRKTRFSKTARIVLSCCKTALVSFLTLKEKSKISILMTFKILKYLNSMLL